MDMSELGMKLGLPPKEAVLSVYSGKPGCACGCRGKYYSRTMDIELSKGYSTHDDASRVKSFPSMLNRVYARMIELLQSGEGERIEFDSGVGVESETRSYTLYTKR